MKTEDQPRTIYGRQQSRPLSASKLALLEKCLPELLAAPLLKSCGKISDIFPEPKDEIWLEIGFGGGEHLLEQAVKNPHIGIIGCEPFLNGLANAVEVVDRQKIKNILIHNGDAREILEALPDESVSRIFLLFPDPWPKKRHHKRRFINKYNLAHIARTLKAGSEFRVGSDIPDYVDWTLSHIRADRAFNFEAEKACDWRIRPDDWPATRYEAKALREGRKPAYMRFCKKR